MTKRSIFIATAALSLALLSGCASDTLGDKGGQDGAMPDKISDVGRTEVFRNVDSYPNVERFCIEGLAFAATSSVDGTRDPQFVRVSEWDQTFCAQ